MDNIHENKATGEVVIMHVKDVYELKWGQHWIEQVSSCNFLPTLAAPCILTPGCIVSQCLLTEKAVKETKSQDGSQIKTTVKSGAGARVYWKVPLGKTWSDIVHSKEKLTVTCLKELGV